MALCLWLAHAQAASVYDDRAYVCKFVSTEIFFLAQRYLSVLIVHMLYKFLSVVMVILGAETLKHYFP